MADPIKKIELKDGSVRYRFVVDIGRDPVTNRRLQKTYTFEHKKEAKNELSRIQHERAVGTFVAPTKVTVSEWLDIWLASATIDVEAGTAANYRDALRPVRERLGDRQLQSVSEGDIDELVTWMLTHGRRRGGKPGTGLSVRSVQLTLGRLRTALNVAVVRQLVVRNVALYTKIPREARKQAAAEAAARTPWSEQEVKDFLARTKGERLRAPVLLSLIGMRPAELCGARWSEDVDFEAGTIRVDLTRPLVDGKPQEKGPKSESGKRTLPLPRPVHEALREFRRVQLAEQVAAGPSYARSGFVLVDQLGRPFKTDQLRRAIHKLMFAAKVRKVRPYDARHACLTYLATSGVPDVIVSAWAGHADLSFTKRVYVHPNIDHLKEAADRLDLLLG